MTEPYKKVGRGGAGNFYSPQDIEVVNKAAESVLSLLPNHPVTITIEKQSLADWHSEI
jgi:hypothetical protein